ncbi:UNVERIFIED_CONTAM: hypothetical protein HHA_214220 [Hammondia hammondi]|eukprot:XP_008885378.1 hypothetical protein HHA_214220 [Hammondia hammondi]
MASLLQSLHRLTFWLVGGTDTAPPAVPVPAKFQPLLGEVLVFLNLRGTVPSDWTREQIMSYVDSSVTDKELQAHAIRFLKETGRLHADAKLTTTKTVSTDVGAATGDFESAPAGRTGLMGRRTTKVFETAKHEHPTERLKTATPSTS